MNDRKTEAMHSVSIYDRDRDADYLVVHAAVIRIDEKWIVFDPRVSCALIYKRHWNSSAVDSIALMIDYLDDLNPYLDVRRYANGSMIAFFRYLQSVGSEEELPAKINIYEIRMHLSGRQQKKRN